MRQVLHVMTLCACPGPTRALLRQPCAPCLPCWRPGHPQLLPRRRHPPVCSCAGGGGLARGLLLPRPPASCRRGTACPRRSLPENSLALGQGKHSLALATGVVTEHHLRLRLRSSARDFRMLLCLCQEEEEEEEEERAYGSGPERCFVALGLVPDGEHSVLKGTQRNKTRPQSKNPVAFLGSLSR